MPFFNPFKKKPVDKTQSEKLAQKLSEKSLRKNIKETREAEERKDEPELAPGVARIDASKKGGERRSRVILKPRITEKASFITSDGAYTFNVVPKANKIQVKQAIEEIFNVHPIRVRMITQPSKYIRVRGKIGRRPGGKKAIVYLKKGERIEFV